MSGYEANINRKMTSSTREEMNGTTTYASSIPHRKAASDSREVPSICMNSMVGSRRGVVLLGVEQGGCMVVPQV